MDLKVILKFKCDFKKEFAPLWLGARLNRFTSVVGDQEISNKLGKQIRNQ